MAENTVVERACAAWDIASSDPWVGELVPCRSAIAVGGIDRSNRVAYLSAGSPIERVLGPGSELQDRQGTQLAIADLAKRLIAGEVTALLAPEEPENANAPEWPTTVLPEPFLRKRQEIRHANVRMRFLLRQIGLEEVSSHRGAPTELYRAAADSWSPQLGLCTDVAMLLSLGADRQRYVDLHYVDRATDRLPRALVRLHGLGVRSYPRLVIV